MNNLAKYVVGIIIAIVLQNTCFSMENVFYVLHDKHDKAIAQLQNHVSLHPIIIAQSYHVNQHGSVTGDIDFDLLRFSKLKAIPIMAMITNSNFDDKEVHAFLENTIAQDAALNQLLDLCRKNSLYGLQFDFEMIRLHDKEALTKFYQHAAELLHKNGFKVSFAVAPTLVDSHFPSFYQERLYEVWQGAYDLKKLGTYADFITIMAYDQHADGTVPGPIAGFVWTELVIKHALKFIPSEKLSLGLPTYSGFWYMNMNPKTKKISMANSSIGYDILQFILKKFHPHVQWDSVSKVNYTFFEYNSLYKYIFIENEKSFKAKLQLAKKYKLRGISVFRLGIEDPKVWGVIA